MQRCLAFKLKRSDSPGKQSFEGSTMSPLANSRKRLRLIPGAIGGTIDGSIMAQMWTRRAELPSWILRLGTANKRPSAFMSNYPLRRNKTGNAELCQRKRASMPIDSESIW